MPEQTDPDFLVNEQYSDASGLSTRIKIQKLYGTHPQSWFRWLFDRLHLRSHSRILELGCGPGDLWLENLDRLPEGLQISLSDLSVGMLREARKRLPGGQGPFHFSLVDAQAITLQAGGLDAAIGIGLLDHVPDRVRALGEIQRVLRPGGIFYTATGGRSHLKEIEELVKPFVPGADYGGDPARFGLANGTKLLSPWFSEIQLHIHRDLLVFRNPEPIIAYVLSESSVRRSLVGEKLERFKHFVSGALEAQGEIEVTTEKGLFYVRKGEAGSSRLV